MAQGEPRPGAGPDGPSVVGPTSVEGRPPRQDRPHRRRRTRGGVEPAVGRPRLPGPHAATRAADHPRRTAGGRVRPQRRSGNHRGPARCPAVGLERRRRPRRRPRRRSPRPGSSSTRGVRIELAEDLTARAIEACVPLLRHPDVPEHIRVTDLTPRPGNRGRHRDPARRQSQRPPDACGAVPHRGDRAR